MRTLSILLVAAIAAAAPASAQMASQNASQNKVSTGPKITLTADQFAMKSAASDMFEIESSKLALVKSKNPQVRRYAQMMIDHHTKSSQRLIAAAKEGTPPVKVVRKLEPMQAAQIKRMQGQPGGAAWDKAYIAAQAKGHEMTLLTLNRYADTGAVPSLKTFAGEMVPIVTQHLAEAQKMAGIKK